MSKRTQEQFLQEILELKRANPDYDIHFCVDADEMLEDGWTSHEIENVEVSPWFDDGDRILTDGERIMDYFFDQSEASTDQEAEAVAKQRYNQEVKMAICVYTRAS